jgi:hypothetical protein
MEARTMLRPGDGASGTVVEPQRALTKRSFCRDLNPDRWIQSPE